MLGMSNCTTYAKSCTEVQIYLSAGVLLRITGNGGICQKLQISYTLSVAHSNATCEDILKSFSWGFRHITHLYSNTPSVRKISQNVHAGVVETFLMK